MREWLYWHFPIITTRWRKNKYAQLIRSYELEKIMNEVCTIERKSAWAAINPIINDLESLRADTWNQDKITYIQKWLRDNFEVKR